MRSWRVRAKRRIFFELGDEAIAKKIDKDDAERMEAVNVGPVKRRKSVVKKKTSVARVMFGKADKEGSYKCLLSDYCTDPKHPEIVKSGSRTSNLLDHARRYHGDVVEALIKAKNASRSIKAEFQGLLESFPKPSARRESMDSHVNQVSRSEEAFKVHLSLLIFIVGSSLPFSIIDSRFFVDWMTVMKYSLPSEATVTKNLGPLYEMVMEMQEQTVRNCRFFSVTFDKHFQNKVPGGDVPHDGRQVLLVFGPARFDSDVVLGLWRVHC